MVTDAGLYDRSRIRYVLHKERNKAPIVIMHNIHEHIYMEVTNEKSFSKPKQPQPVEMTSDLLL